MLEAVRHQAPKNAIGKQYSSVSSMTVELRTDAQCRRYRCSGRCIHAILVVLSSGGLRRGRGFGRELCAEGQVQCNVYDLLLPQLADHFIPLDSSLLHDAARPASAAADACTDVDVCIFFVGSSMIAVHEQAGPGEAYSLWSATTESEGFDRSHIKLPGSQEEIIKVTMAPTYAMCMHFLLSPFSFPLSPFFCLFSPLSFLISDCFLSSLYILLYQPRCMCACE